MTQEEKADEKIRHIVQIANTDLDGKKSVDYALTGINGISRRVARVIAHNAKINHQATMGYLSDEEINRIKRAVDGFEKSAPAWMVNRRGDIMSGANEHLLGSKLIMTLREDINLMRKIRCYKGIRHERGHKVRGQRTKSTGRRGAAVGVTRRALLAQQKAGEKEGR
jgi:small subunit ribosomal protein S13